MKVRASGDTMLLIELEARIDPAVNERAIRIAERLHARLGSSVRDIVPGYRTIGIHFDPLRTDSSELEAAIQQEAAAAEAMSAATPHHVIEIPVVYGGAGGPDLHHVAEWAQMTAEQVIAIHAATEYRVYMLGFVPGFAYLGRVDERIAAARRATPRDRVPAGSVGIAGAQTGVYPISTPGGWQLIGRTAVTMFDARRDPPSLLNPGDRVRFVAS